MSARKDAIREFIVSKNAESMQVLTGLGEADWGQPVYSTESATWTVRDVLAHLADSERGLLGQIRRQAVGQQTIPPDFDLQRWNRRAVEKRAGQPAAELLAEIQARFAEALDVLAGLDDADLDKTGRHPRGDEPDLETCFRHMAEHRAGHAAEIRAALGR